MDHFGLTPLPSEPDAVADRVISWWAAAREAGGAGPAQPVPR
ncbi:hypothetical protein [Streptomyces sp. NPDC048551]